MYGTTRVAGGKPRESVENADRSRLGELPAVSSWMENITRIGWKDEDEPRGYLLVEKVDIFGIWVIWILRKPVKDTRTRFKNDAPI